MQTLTDGSAVPSVWTRASLRILRLILASWRWEINGLLEGPEQLFMMDSPFKGQLKGPDQIIQVLSFSTLRFGK